MIFIQRKFASHCATRNGAANALKQLREVEQISVQFVSEYSL